MVKSKYYDINFRIMNKEQLQWIVITLIIVGLIGVGGMVMSQSSQLNQVSRSLMSISSQVQDLSQRSTVAAAPPVQQVAPTSAPAVVAPIVSPPTQSLSLYTDPQSGINFVVPSGWTVGSDEGGNVNIVKADSSVSFEVLTNKAEWQKRMSAPGVNNDDVQLKKEVMTVGGFPATQFIFQRNTGVASSFQYGEYFVDGGSKWYVVSTTAPSADITQIIQSIKF